MGEKRFQRFRKCFGSRTLWKKISEISLIRLIANSLWTIHLRSFEVIEALFHFALPWLSLSTISPFTLLHSETKIFVHLLSVWVQLSAVQFHPNFMLFQTFCWSKSAPNRRPHPKRNKHLVQCIGSASRANKFPEKNKWAHEDSF